MTALYDSNPDISHRKRLAPERAVACPRSGKRLQVQTGPDSAGSAEKTGDPRGAWSAEAAGSRLGSRPPLSLHSPEARAGSPSAEAPRGRRLQRRGRRRIMPQRSWPGRVDPDPLGSARLAPVGPVCGKQQPSRRESPTPRLKSRDERPRNWTRRGQDAAPAPFRPHRPGLPGGRFGRRLRRAHPTPSFQKLGGSWRRGGSVYGKTTKRRFPGKGGPEEKLGAYGAPRGPRRVAM